MRDLPTGVVTFMFTDLEGSTRLLERLGERYRDVQQQHDAILRAAIAEGDGLEVSTEGDAFFAVFPVPAGAVRAAVAAQRGLASSTWPDESLVRVRMGLHTGDGVLGGDSYLGLDVNLTARIAAAAHGGQVLLSDASRGLLEGGLPAGVRMRDLGPHRLKDFSEPRRLSQLLIEGLPEDFPPLRTLDGRRDDLPTQLTRFIGRADDRAAVRGLLTGNRLVTLTGPGGTGKTRLAVQVATDTLPDMRDGASFVDLSSVSDAQLVAEAIAGALRVRLEPGRAALETLIDNLRSLELLVVLDNLEQVVDAGSSVVEPLLQQAPGVRVLATSRVPLHLYGESEYPVSPLTLPDPDHLPDLATLAHVDAVALFVQRATAGDPGFTLTPANARVVAEITARLDGLPLAIELAASRASLLSPEQLLRRLERRLPLLSAQDRNVPERQRTLRQTIDWSYELLDEPERRMFWRLAVFVGGADLDAAEAIADPDGALGLETLEGLGSLIDKNLLRRLQTIDEPRFSMLETIREYGLERLSASDEEAAVRRRHAEHWIDVASLAATALSGPDQASATRRLDRDHDNFRSALGWALRTGEADVGLRLSAALREYWRVGSHFREGVGWIDDLLALPAAAPRTQARARALTTAADLSSWMGEDDGYLARAEEAVSIYHELDDGSGLADALGELGTAQISAGRYEAAGPTLDEAIERSLHIGNQGLAATCTLARGMLGFFSGRLDESRHFTEAALAMFAERGDPFWTAFAERMVGGVDRAEGDLVAAQARYRSSLISAQEHGALMVIASDLFAFADLAQVRGDNDRALRLAGASEMLRERIGDAPSLEAATVGDVVGAARGSMDATDADRSYQEGRALGIDEAIAYALMGETR